MTACSEKAQATPTWKKTFGFHPLTAFADHGPDGSGEPLAIMLRPGNAGSNTAADHIEITRLALAQLPATCAARCSSAPIPAAAPTSSWPGWPSRAAGWPTRSGSPSPTTSPTPSCKIPARAWTPAYDSGGQVRPGAWVAEITGMLDLTVLAGGMRVIVRKERPHPGAQLRFTDIDGHRFTCFATSTKGGQLADLELRHRRRARCEDRIRNAKDTGLRNLPLHGYEQNQIWCEIVALACELLAWMQMLALDRPCPPLGTQTAAAADLRRGRAHRPRRPPPAAPPRRHAGPGPARSPPPSPGCTPWHPADQPHPVPTTRKENHGPVEPAHPARQPGHQARPNAENKHQPPPQATNPRSRKIEANSPERQTRGQITDIEPAAPEITEYVAHAKECPGCGAITAGGAARACPGPGQLRAGDLRAGREPGQRPPASP